MVFESNIVGLLTYRTLLSFITVFSWVRQIFALSLLDCLSFLPLLMLRCCSDMLR